MFRLIITNFKRTNECIILAPPMVLFMFITVLYSAFIVTHAKTINLALFSFITLLIMISGFLAGWFYMVKKSLQLVDRTFVYESDRIDALKKLISSLPNGVGRYFLSFLGFLTISMLITVFFYYLSVSVVPISGLEKLAQTFELEDYTVALLFIITSILTFWGMLWIPEIIYSEKNIIKSLYNSIVKTFKTFPKTLFLYIFIYILYTMTNISIQFIPPIPALMFILLVLHYYTILYIVILVFAYYEQTFFKQN